MKRRSALGLSATMIGGVTLGYAGIIEPSRLKVREETLPILNLPREFEGLKIAHLSDFHYRPRLESGLVKRVVERTQDFNPDLIAMTGDFIEQEGDVLDELLEKLSSLTAPLGVYGVLGNHDRSPLSLEELQAAFNKSSVQLLVNEVLQVPVGEDSTLQLIGLDSMYTHGTRFDLEVPEEKNTFRLVLLHEPDVFPRVARTYKPHLQLSGHTHGGQCRIPFMNRPMVTPYLGRVYLEGAYAEGHSKLYVTTGIGTSGPRLRFSCPPEIVLLTLKGA